MKATNGGPKNRKSTKGIAPAPSKADMRGRVKSDFPKHSLEEALKVAQALEDVHGGMPLPPLDLALALGISPGSSELRTILSASSKYGLTSGSFNADRIKLEALGREIVEPTSSEAAKNALVQAAFTPSTFQAIFNTFKGKKVPEQKFFENSVTRDFGIPKEHGASCVRVFTANAEYVGLVKYHSSGKWLSSDPAVRNGESEKTLQSSAPLDVVTEAEEDISKRLVGFAEKIGETVTKIVEENRKVYISHGKSRDVVAQLKELLTFGNFHPVVSVEKDSPSIPVPDKVFEDMRECSAAVIHVMSEGELLDPQGQKVPRINENVLIEIGAAIALYKKKFVLLVHKGVRLPSNLQGLYRCEYEGEKLDYEATMKLLKTFNQFRDSPSVV